jgi:hypothetical protein
MQSQLYKTRIEQKRKYELLQKIKVKLEFNKKKRSEYRIFYFFQKIKYKLKPVNFISQDVPIKYRFIFYGYINPILEYTLENHNEIIKNIINNNDYDSDCKNEMTSQVEKKLEMDIINSPLSVKLKFVIDIRDEKNINKGKIIKIYDIGTVFIKIETIYKLQKFKKNSLKNFT